MPFDLLALLLINFNKNLTIPLFEIVTNDHDSPTQNSNYKQQEIQFFFKKFKSQMI